MTKIVRVHDAFSVVFEWEGGPVEGHSLLPKKKKKWRKRQTKKLKTKKAKDVCQFLHHKNACLARSSERLWVNK